MFNNHTAEDAFRIFESRYKDILYLHYAHLRKFSIHCYTFEQYRNLSNVPILDSFSNDTFAYAVYRLKDSELSNTFAAIVFSPAQCGVLSFCQEEYLAAIAHEVGHIIHYFNENLNGVNELVREMKADSIAIELGLSDYLKSVLGKLKESGLYNNAQCSMMTMRTNLLNYEKATYQ